MIETGGDFGGTWYWNRYPGVQCDIESYIYLPLLEELGYVPELGARFPVYVRLAVGQFALLGPFRVPVRFSVRFSVP